MERRTKTLMSFALAAFALSFVDGCAAPSATLELVTVARRAITDAKSVQASQHDELLRQMESQQAALDAAFDADVTAAAAGALKDASGQPVPLSADWVISARKGYALARDALAHQMRSAEAAHRVNQDNLAAADEALDLAGQLIVAQWNVTERIKTQLIAAQRRLTYGR